MTDCIVIARIVKYHEAPAAWVKTVTGETVAARQRMTRGK